MKHEGDTKMNGKTCVVGLSGGVDSSVAIALLQEDGARGFGCYLKGYTIPGVPCSEEQDIIDARKIAQILGIHFEVVNEGSEFYRKNVYEDFIGTLFAGKTPNPDVRCNQFVKFPLLKQLKDKYGADFAATGHYFRRVGDRFFMARDREKDQSYFLWPVKRELLLEFEFPIGEFTKEEVREMARNRKLPVADKESTRGVCMVGELSVADALSEAARVMGKELLPARAILVDGDKKIELGKILGPVFFAATIGQRSGFEISYKFPIYVTNKDVENLILYFAINPSGPKSFYVSGLNWLAPDAESFKFPMRLQVKIRTPGKLLPARLARHGGDAFEVSLDESDPGVAPGQSAVFYRKVADDEIELLGGGVIQ